MLKLRAKKSSKAEEEAEAEMQLSMERKKLKREIETSKRKKWRELCAEIDENIWGERYKIATKRLRTREQPPATDIKKRLEIVKTLFPKHPVKKQKASGEAPETAFKPFTKEELEMAVRRLKTKRALGPDGIPAEALKLLVSESPEILLNVFNSAVKKGVFPSIWKRATLILLKKPNKLNDDPR